MAGVSSGIGINITGGVGIKKPKSQPRALKKSAYGINKKRKTKRSAR